MQIAYQITLFLKNVLSTLFVKFFAEKSRKFLNLEKFENLMKSIFEKKPFSSFQQNRRAESMLMVAGRPAKN